MTTPLLLVLQFQASYSYLFIPPVPSPLHPLLSQCALHESPPSTVPRDDGNVKAKGDRPVSSLATSGLGYFDRVPTSNLQRYSIVGDVPDEVAWGLGEDWDDENEDVEHDEGKLIRDEAKEGDVVKKPERSVLIIFRLNPDANHVSRNLKRGSRANDEEDHRVVMDSVKKGEPSADDEALCGETSGLTGEQRSGVQSLSPRRRARAWDRREYSTHWALTVPLATPLDCDTKLVLNFDKDSNSYDGAEASGHSATSSDRLFDLRRSP
ncbi:hypothetical protein NMY22_g19183 [Coprinellus aureogranulatus]|nr:hypothetical protein NMY22_g19183 [Coprinellus aureogranulatus]